MGSFASQVVQLVKETSYGVTPGTPTYNRLNAMRIGISQQYEANPFAGTGLVVPSLVTIDDKFVEGDVEGRAAYNDLGFILCSLFGAPTTTTPGGATLARQHVWTWNGSTEPAWISYTAQYGDASLADTVTGLVFRSFEYGGGRMDGLDFGASILAKPLTTGATLDASPTIVPAVPINAPEMDVYMDPTWAAVGSTKLLKTYNANLSIADRLDRTRPINSTQSSDGIVQLSDQEHTLDLQMEVDATSKALYAVADAGSFRYVQVRNTGKIIEAAIAYSLKIDTAIMLVGTSGYEEYNNIHAITWNGRLGQDSGGNCLRITLVNTVTAY